MTREPLRFFVLKVARTAGDLLGVARGDVGGAQARGRPANHTGARALERSRFASQPLYTAVTAALHRSHSRAARASPPRTRPLTAPRRARRRQVVYPMLCHDAADAELWEDDPIEFIRHTYDVITPPDWQGI